MTIYITILVKENNKKTKNDETTPQIACHTGLKYIYLSHCIYYLTCTESVVLHPTTYQHLLHLW